MLGRILLLFATLFSTLSYSSIPQRTPYIVNGANVTQGDIPWQAAVESPSGVCGGVIIGSQWVLTAAHCVTDSNTDQPNSISGIKIYSGSVIRNQNTAYNATQLDVYPGYTNDDDLIGSYYDIALIRISGGFPANSAIKMLSSNQQLDIEISNTWVDDQPKTPNLLVSGWGITNGSDINSNPYNLQATLLSGVPDSVCRQKWKLNIPASYVLCASPPNPAITNTSCKGDSGGPVVWQDPNYQSDADRGYRLAGLVSAGPGECKVSAPELETQVSQFYNWVKSKTGTLVTDTTTSSFPVDIFQKYASTAQAPSSGGSGGGGGTMSIFSFLFLCALTRIRRSR